MDKITACLTENAYKPAYTKLVKKTNIIFASQRVRLQVSNLFTTFMQYFKIQRTLGSFRGRMRADIATMTKHISNSQKWETSNIKSDDAYLSF